MRYQKNRNKEKGDISLISGRCVKMMAVALVAVNSNNLSLSAEIQKQELSVAKNKEVEIEINTENTEQKEFISIIAESALGYEIVGDDKEEEKDYVTLDVIVSYYTSLPEENGVNYGGRNAIGGYLTNTSVAIPRTGIIEYGMTLEFESMSEAYMKDYNGKYLTRVADDCGSPSHIRVREDGVYRIDIYCPKFSYESDSQYYRRVNNYGKHQTTCKVYLKK